MTGRARSNGEGSIFPYRNGYAAYAWVTKPNGRRARKYMYGKTEPIVRDKWNKLREAAEHGPVETTSTTVKVYALNWLDEVVKPNLAPSTYSKYETFVRRYIVPGLGKKRVDRLTVRDVQTWLNKVRVTCQCCAQGKDVERGVGARCCALKPRQCCNDVPSPSTVRAIRECLRSMLSAAMTDELVARNVAALVRLPHGRSRQSQAWTSEQARRFLESARRDGDPLFALYVMILVLGLRKGEALGLGWSDVHLDAGETHLTHQLQRVGGDLLRRELKTQASAASLPLPDFVISSLKQRCQEQEADREAAGAAWQSSGGLVFTTRFGTPIEPRNVNRSFRRQCEKAGVPVMTVHDARRTCATLLVDLGVHPRVIMQILRHSKIAMTMEIYSKVTPDQTRDALRQLGDSLGWSADEGEV